MATEVVCIVDTDGTQNPDYTSLNAAIVGESGASPVAVTGTDLVTNDEQLTIECRATAGAADTTVATVTGFTTSSDCFLKIYSTGTHRHEGIWSDSKYRLDCSDTPLIFYDTDPNYIVMGLQIGRNGAADHYLDSIRHADHRTGSVVIDSCIIRGSGNAFRSRLIQLGLDSRFSPEVTYRNNVMYRLDTTVSSGSSVFYRSYSGNQPTDTIRFDNNVIIGGVANLCYFIGLPAVTPEVNYNNNIFISSDDLGTGSEVLTGDNNIFSFNDDIGGANDISNVILKDATTDTLTAAAKSTDNWVIFTDPDNGDVSLVSVNDEGELNDAINAGTDLSSVMHAVDIIGTTRPQGAAWDIGAFEYVASASGGSYTSIFDGRIRIKSAATNSLDGLITADAAASGSLDGKIKVAVANMVFADGKIRILTNAEDTLGGKVIVLNSDTNALDGRVSIGTGAVNVFDGLIRLKDSTSSMLDGKITLGTDLSDLLDGKLSVRSAATALLDGTLLIPEVVTDTLDGKIRIKDTVALSLDGSIRIALSAENNIDGKLYILGFGEGLSVLSGKLGINTFLNGSSMMGKI